MSNIDVNKQVGEYTLGQNHIIESIWLKYRNNSQGDWIIKVQEVIRLHEKLKVLQPKHILELGTGIGCSTEIMAFTCPNASIYTVEQNQKCIDLAKKMIPEKFQERIYFKKCDVRVGRQFEVTPFQDWLVYSSYDWRNYDFIFIDGPGPIMAKAKNPKTGEIWEAMAELPGGDLFQLLHLMKEGTLVYIDKRRLAVLFYQRFLSEYLELAEGDKDYAIFRRNSKPLMNNMEDFVNGDLTYRGLTKMGYFDELQDENS